MTKHYAIGDVVEFDPLTDMAAKGQTGTIEGVKFGPTWQSPPIYCVRIHETDKLVFVGPCYIAKAAGEHR